MDDTGILTMHTSPEDSPAEHTGVHIWFCDLDDPEFVRLGRYIASHEESSGAELLNDPLERQRYLARCAFVRLVLANILKVSPAVFGMGAATGAGSEVEIPVFLLRRKLDIPRVSYSHSSHVFAMALAFGRDIGIDIKVSGRAPVPSYVSEPAARYGSAEQHAGYDAEAYAAAFVRTRRRALAKATGEVIGDPAYPPRARCRVRSFGHRVGETDVMCAVAWT